VWVWLCTERVVVSSQVWYLVTQSLFNSIESMLSSPEVFVDFQV
jgi:hypothetical protein